MVKLLDFTDLYAKSAARQRPVGPGGTKSGKAQWLAQLQSHMAIPTVEGTVTAGIVAQFDELFGGDDAWCKAPTQQQDLRLNQYDAVFGWQEVGASAAVVPAPAGEEAWRRDLQRASQAVFQCSAELKLRKQAAAPATVQS
jgi:hypothetical protein